MKNRLFTRFSTPAGGRRRIGKALVTTILLVAFLAAAQGAMAGVVKVYWTERNTGEVWSYDLTTGTSQMLAQNFQRLQDIDLDTSTGVLYFADWGAIPLPSDGSINSVNRDGTGLATVFNTNDAVHQLAIDEPNQLIYYTRAVSYDNHEISVITTGGLGYTPLFGPAGFAGPGWFPSGLALDAANSLLYWGDIGILNLPPNGSVNSMTTGGLAIAQLTPWVSGRGRGMALEASSQTIFLTAHDPSSPTTGGGVFSYDIANNIETLLISDPNTGYWDIEIDPTAQRIWWTDVGRGEIRSAKFDGTDIQIELAGLTGPYGLALEIDSDGDGVPDVLDVCPETVIPEGVPTRDLGVNRFALVDDDGIFDTTSPNGKGPRKSFTIEDTAGCSCEQIIEALDLGVGHSKFGCSISAMEDWTALVNP